MRRSTLPRLATSGSGAAVALAAAALLLAAAPATADFTATRTADGAVLAGDAVPDQLVLKVSADGTQLVHNRFGTDRGFASAADFDSAVPRVQPLANDAATS